MDLRDHGDECFCASCVRNALPVVDVFRAQTFEEHMSPEVIWTEDPEFAKAWEDLSEKDEEFVDHETANLQFGEFVKVPLRTPGVSHMVKREN